MWRCTCGCRGGGLMVAIAGLLLAVGCERQAPQSASPEALGPTKKLVVLTPHSEDIRTAFARGFATWCLVHRNTSVHLEWIYRGTPQCVEYARAARAARSQGAPEQPVDVLFGGGVIDHQQLAAEQLALPLDLKDALADIPAEINGVPTRDGLGHWFATGLSSFGILYNERACQQRGIAPPTTWADLADPRFAGWLAVADPAASSSHRECLALIVRQQGWEQGWATILRILGNTRALEARSADALRQVRAGTALATFAVNFDGMSLAGEGGGALKYIDPPGATAATLEVISLLAGTQNRELAQDFVRYVLSDEGQALLGVQSEYRAPHVPPLYHYPIKPSIYEKYKEHLAIARNPFQESFGLKCDELDPATRPEALVRALIQAACTGDQHVRLQNAWRQVVAGGMAPDKLAALTALPFPATDAPELVAKLAGPATAETQALVQQWADALAARLAPAGQAAAPGGE
jgi:iron(III) transport system substrate-binding protein